MAVKSRVKVACKEVNNVLQFRQIPMTAVAVEQYRPAMDSCMAGTRLCRTCALTAPDSSDPATGRVSGSVWAVSVGIF